MNNEMIFSFISTVFLKTGRISGYVLPVCHKITSHSVESSPLIRIRIDCSNQIPRWRLIEAWKSINLTVHGKFRFAHFNAFYELSNTSKTREHLAKHDIRGGKRIDGFLTCHVINRIDVSIEFCAATSKIKFALTAIGTEHIRSHFSSSLIGVGHSRRCFCSSSHALSKWFTWQLQVTHMHQRLQYVYTCIRSCSPKSKKPGDFKYDRIWSGQPKVQHFIFS